ncbi:signal peptidase II [Candidatus Woesearchaeota archaeon]|nr:signal peptidase II [Candidatus Woesearchaeota archaeon]
MAVLTRFIYISAGVAILDQISKLLARRYLPITANTGSAFGILQGWNGALLLLSLAVMGYIIFSYTRIQRLPFLTQACTACIFGGALGNSIDRALFGAVTDFISLGFWPSFNVADSAITVGVAGLIILSLTKDRKNN